MIVLLCCNCSLKLHDYITSEAAQKKNMPHGNHFRDILLYLCNITQMRKVIKIKLLLTT